MEGQLQFRRAVRGDLEAIVALFADDELGATREDASLPLNPAYEQAFEAIDRDENQHVLVAELRGEVIAAAQLTLIPYLSRMGSSRSIVESVRVASHLRGQGIGRQLMREAIRISRQWGCHLVQLTTDKARRDTRRFYESLGFVASHDGMKLFLDAY